MDGYEASTYGDAFADVYDDWYGDAEAAEGAADCLARLAAGGPVLELGVGTGRLAAPLADRGVEVWGVDASSAMLDRLAARPGGERVRAVLGDMADPAAALAAAGEPGPADGFAVVVAAFNTLFLVASAQGQATCLRSSASLLAPGGAVVVECYVPADPPPRTERVVEPRRVGVDHVVLTVTEHDPVAQRVVGQHVELREDGTRLRPWVLRYARPDQLDELAAGAGLRLDRRWSGWDETPFTDGDPMHVSVYRAG